MLFRDACWQPRWTPLSIDARRSYRTNALELLATVILNLLIVTDAAHVVAVFELARYSHQKYLTVIDFPRKLAVV